MNSRCRGQGLSEYLLICSVLAAALFTPYLAGESVATLLARTLIEYFRGLAFITSVL